MVSSNLFANSGDICVRENIWDIFRNNRNEKCYNGEAVLFLCFVATYLGLCCININASIIQISLIHVYILFCTLRVNELHLTYNFNTGFILFRYVGDS